MSDQEAPATSGCPDCPKLRRKLDRGVREFVGDAPGASISLGTVGAPQRYAAALVAAPDGDGAAVRTAPARNADRPGWK